MTGAPARIAAAHAIAQVRETGAAFPDALATARGYDRLSAQDRAFARALGYAAFRAGGRIDAALAPYLARPLPKSAGLADALLRIGAAQLLVLETPPHAAVGATVAAAKADRASARFAGLINAVLRKAAGADARARFDAAGPCSAPPGWLMTRWRAAYGDACAERIAAAIADEPPLDLTVRNGGDESWSDRMPGATVTPTGSVRLPSLSDVTALPGFEQGTWWVQDAAAALPARLLGVTAGAHAIDLCAAPGGKTMQLAAMGARVTAVDGDKRRLARLRDNLARTGLAAEIVAADARTWRPQTLAPFVLLDAPCSATGTARRRPDVLWARKPAHISELVQIQDALLDAAAEMVAPGGRLVFCTCSIEPEEGPERAAAFLKRRRMFRRSPIAPDAAPTLEAAIDPLGDLRLTPAHGSAWGGVDGFFVARFIRDEGRDDPAHAP